MKKGLLNIIGISEKFDVTKGFLVHLLRFGVRTPHICVSEYDLANCLTDLGLHKPEVKRLVETAKESGEATTAEISFSKRQVHKYWAGPIRPA